MSVAFLQIVLDAALCFYHFTDRYDAVFDIGSSQYDAYIMNYCDADFQRRIFIVFGHSTPGRVKKFIGRA